MRKICTGRSSPLLKGSDPKSSPPYKGGKLFGSDPTPRSKGSEIEKMAALHLQSHGVEILQQNFQCKMGEIDIIGKHKNELVFIEVRYRKNTFFGTPAESVTFSKQQKLTRTAQYYLNGHREFRSLPCRFDVIAVTDQSNKPYSLPGKPYLEWIQNAFDSI